MIDNVFVAGEVPLQEPVVAYLLPVNQAVAVGAAIRSALSDRIAWAQPAKRLPGKPRVLRRHHTT